MTRENLAEIYRRLLDQLAEFDIPATFAFVGMFVLDDDDRRHFEPRLGPVPYGGADWLGNFRSERDAGRLDGWFCPEALEMVREDGRHEIASHGFTHVPFDGPDTPLDVYLAETRMIRELGERKGVEFRTLVFPRHRTGHTELLRQAGIEAYREPLAGRDRSVLRLLRELNVLERSQQRRAIEDTPLVCIPGGYFLNWRHGVRRRIPLAVSLARWSSVLRHAARTGGVAHVWSHPHNFISAPSTMPLFRGILRKAAALRARGELKVLTQAQYADEARGDRA